MSPETPTVTHLEVRRDDLGLSRLHEIQLAAPADGQAILEVERFALTANNVTYATLGDALGYWHFFPASAPWGRVPAWGSARVVAAGATSGLREGASVFGFVPMATHLTVEPQRVSPAGFTDATPHRAPLPAAYNAYETPARDGDEDAYMLLRPLFALAFLLDDQLADEVGAEAPAVIITSASSRTSSAIAFQATQRGARVLALTSDRNRDFVERLGRYDEVRTYADAGTLDRHPTVLVDVAGSAAVRRAVHERLGEALRRSVLVGTTHEGGRPLESMEPGERLPGATPTWFFAPDRMRQRIREWGRAGYEQRLEEAWKDYLAWAESWLRIERRGREAARGTWREVLEGTASPATGYAVSLLTPQASGR